MTPAEATEPLVVACAAIWRGGRLLLARRADNGLWELPGGKQRPGEDLAACLAREINEELGVAVEVGGFLGLVEQRGHGRPLDLHCFACRLLGAEPRALEHLELRWVRQGELARLELCPADVKLLGQLQQPPAGS